MKHLAHKSFIITYTIFHVINFVIMAYMGLQTLKMIYTCRCAVINLWWVGIAIYFLSSLAIAIYMLAYLMKYNHGAWTLQCTITTIVTAILFVWVTLYYLQTLQASNTCKCVQKKYIVYLQLLIKLRYALISLISSFGIFIILGVIIYWNYRH